MQEFQVLEPVATRRIFFLFLVDATDGITPENGEAAGQPQYSKNGAAFGNTVDTLHFTGNGAYYITLDPGEIDTLGWILVRYKSANTAEFSSLAAVTPDGSFGKRSWE